MPRFLPPFVWRLGRPSDAFLFYFQLLSLPSLLAAMPVQILNMIQTRLFSGSIINAIGGPIAMGAPIQISAAWFPPHVSWLPLNFRQDMFPGKNSSHFHRTDVQRTWGEQSLKLTQNFHFLANERVHQNSADY